MRLTFCFCSVRRYVCSNHFLFICVSSLAFSRISSSLGPHTSLIYRKVFIHGLSSTAKADDSKSASECILRTGMSRITMSCLPTPILHPIRLNLLTHPSSLLTPNYPYLRSITIKITHTESSHRKTMLHLSSPDHHRAHHAQDGRLVVHL